MSYLALDSNAWQVSVNFNFHLRFHRNANYNSSNRTVKNLLLHFADSRILSAKDCYNTHSWKSVTTDNCSHDRFVITGTVCTMFLLQWRIVERFKWFN